MSSELLGDITESLINNDDDEQGESS